MKIERLVDAIGGIDDELIQAAVNDNAFIMKQKRKKNIAAVCIACAACVCLTVGGFLAHSIISNRYVPDSSELTSDRSSVDGQNDISNVDSVPMGQGFFNARVLEVKTEAILVECTKSYDEVIHAGDKLEMSLNTLSDEEVPNVKVGDDLRILYFGEVKEQSDGVLAPEKTVSIFLLDEIGATK